MFLNSMIRKDETTEIDLVTVLDVAIRDLRDIAKQCRGDTREQAEACLRMLRAALNAAGH